MQEQMIDGMFLEADKQNVEGIVLRAPEGEDGGILFVQGGQMQSYRILLENASRQLVSAVMRLSGLDPQKRDRECEGILVRHASHPFMRWKAIFIPTEHCEEMLLRRLPDGEAADSLALPRPQHDRRAALAPRDRDRLPGRLSVA
ncbi:hypothetical protein HY631_00245 [Candidatus Uhrbacteria bacterium]|nr:hypothetical protein [Candidatus Uhrbacteria bacterium]